jgi:hypothetical protein
MGAIHSSPGRGFLANPNPPHGSSRRQFLRQSLAATALVLSAPSGLRAALAGGAEATQPVLPPIEFGDRSGRAPALPVGIGRCRDFEVKKLAETLSSLLDKIGGIDRLMRGKTVTLKLNNTGG